MSRRDRDDDNGDYENGNGDYDNRTPLDIAKDMNYNNMVKFLESLK